MDWDRFFELNRAIILFIYGQVFFTLGLAIFLQSRRHSRLKLARHLRWLAGFGVLHGLHEWGLVFIPIQATYLEEKYIHILRMLQISLLVVSFACLYLFGLSLFDMPSRVWRFGLLPIAIWVSSAIVSFFLWHNTGDWLIQANIWARYLLGFPGGVISAYGLYRLSRNEIISMSGRRTIGWMLMIASGSLLEYAFFAGLVVKQAPFFPANILNRSLFENGLGLPIEIFRSLAGLSLAISMIRALDIFEIEVDSLIERMEVETIQAAERNRIGQEIHDGAIQAIYSASLVLETVERAKDSEEVRSRLNRTHRILQEAISELRGYMVSLRHDVPSQRLEQGIKTLATDPRFSTLMDIRLDVADPLTELTPTQVRHVLAIVQECLSNSARHASAQSVILGVTRSAANCPVITVKDDGHGFDIEHVRRGFGLTAMQERARLLGGRIEIDSALGKSTTITLTILKDDSR